MSLEPSSEPNFSFKKERVDDEFFEVTSSDRYIGREVQQRYSISQIPVRLDDMNVKDGELLNPCRLYSGWANARKLQEFINNGCSPLEVGEDTIHFYLNQNGCIRYPKTRISARNILSVLRGLGTTEKSKTILRKMGVNFDYPKPVPLLKYLISIGASATNSIVMDSFAGSGTTAQAVMELNAEEAVSRKFILVEMDGKIATDAAAKRLNKVSAGYEYLEKNGKAVKVSGVGGGFRFCRLGVPLFDEFGDIADAVTFSDLAAHIFFSETGVPIPHRAQSEFLGIHQGRAVYLLFNEGNREVPQEAAGNVLTPNRLDRLPPNFNT